MTNLFGLPHLQHRHTSNDGVGILLRCRIDRVVGANNKRQVRLCGRDIEAKQNDDSDLGHSAPQLFMYYEVLLLYSIIIGL